MTTSNDFVPPYDIGGPMPLGQGYRWNVPTLTYGFDQSFLNYFGSNGVAAVESAINVLNDLPPASQLSPTNFAYDTTYVNYVAQSLYLMDLKSEALFLLVEHLGLASPSRFAYTLKTYTITNEVVNGQVLQLNYDPLTHQPSAYVNNALVAYYLTQGHMGNTAVAFAQTFPADPLADGFDSAVAEAASGYSYGELYAGLTADDIGGLAYLYTTNNVVLEALPPDVQAPNAGSFVDFAARQGVDKITFVPQRTNVVTGGFSAMTNVFTDRYITNGGVFSQLLQRVTTQPDFLFTVTNVVANGALYDRTSTANWASNPLPGIPGGPGVIEPSVRIAFANLGPQWQNFDSSGNDVASQSSSAVWGTFDASTNAPIIYEPGSATNGTPVLMTLSVDHQLANYRWVAQGTNAVFSFQTSTNLTTWSTLFPITNNGSLSTYNNYYPAAVQRFYRIVPQ